MKDTRYVYGARCAWNGPIQSVGKTDTGPPVCPHCGSPLFEMETDEWWAGVDRYDAVHPGYRKMVEWAADKHFFKFTELQAAYNEATGAGFSL